MKLTDEQALDLVKDGTLDIGGGYLLRFRMEPDDATSVNDFDDYGKVHHCYRDNDSRRPEGFDGMSEKISTPYDTYWWQPPEDLRSGWHNYEHKRHLRNALLDVLTFGFSVYIVELCHEADAYGRPIVVDYNSCGGYEPLMSDDDIAGELVNIVWDMETVEQVA